MWKVMQEKYLGIQLGLVESSQQNPLRERSMLTALLEHALLSIV